VLEARDRQHRRLADSGWQTNGEVSGTYLRRHLPLPDGLQTVDEAVHRGRLSAPGVDKVLRLDMLLADPKVHTLTADPEIAAG
jgi:magnesium chelatase family protein